MIIVLIEDDAYFQVCGCPLVKNLFEATGNICRLPKKKCNKHVCWEKLRRAELDMERVRNVRCELTNLKRFFIFIYKMLLNFSG